LPRGTLIRKDGQVYTVLANAHAVTPGEPHLIRTPDGKQYPAQIINVTERGYDLAILQFAADGDYEVATMARSSTQMVNQPEPCRWIMNFNAAVTRCCGY